MLKKRDRKPGPKKHVSFNEENLKATSSKYYQCQYQKEKLKEVNRDLDETFSSINLLESQVKENVSKENISMGSILKEHISMESISKGNVSKENISEESKSMENIAKENIPEKNISEENIPEEKILKENIPEEYKPKENKPEENILELNIPKKNILELNIPKKNMSNANIFKENISELNISEANMGQENVLKENVSNESNSFQNIAPAENIQRRTKLLYEKLAKSIRIKYDMLQVGRRAKDAQKTLFERRSKEKKRHYRFPYKKKVERPKKKGPDEDIIEYSYNASPCSIVLWFVVSIFSVMTIDISPESNTVNMGITTTDMTIMIFCTILLLLGLKMNKPFFLFPWLLASLLSLWFCQYKSLVQILRTFAYKKAYVYKYNLSPIAQIAFYEKVLSVGVLGLLWLKVGNITWRNIVGMWRKSSNLQDFLEVNL